MSTKRPGKRGPRELSDWHLWTQVQRTVDPLGGKGRKAPTDRESLERALNTAPEDAKEAPKPAAKPKKRTTLRPNGPANPDALAYTLSPAQTPGKTIEPKLKRRVVNGRVALDARLDLHGMTQAQAHAALLRFVPARAARGDRTVLIITGKGLANPDPLADRQRGILRSSVPRWLGEPPLRALVAGLEPAHISHGGEGAFYVRLRRARAKGK